MEQRDDSPLEQDLPDWVESGTEGEVVLEGSPIEHSAGAPPEQIFVQAGQFGPAGTMPATNAVVALVLSILGVMMCSVCTAVPGLILANGALATANQYPGHPDIGMAKAAQIIAWIAIGLTILGILLYLVMGAAWFVWWSGEAA